MSTLSPTPTSTYPFTSTTYTNLSPSTRTSYPTTYTDATWLSSVSAGTDCSSATAYPSIERPLGNQVVCAVRNDAEINPYAFQDVYDCCPDHNLLSYGYWSPLDGSSNVDMCMVQCHVPDEGPVMWQEVGACLQMRVEKVFCKAKYAEPPGNLTDESESIWSEHARPTSSSGSGPSVQTGAGVGSNAGLEGTGPSGSAASIGIVHATTLKVGVFCFVTLAVGSAVGMFL